MMHRQCLFALAALIGLSGAATAAEPVQVKDAADLFPADTLLYVEAVKPAEAAQEVAAFLKGSIIEDLPAYMSKWHEKRGDGFYMETYMLGTFGTFLGPEGLAEISRMQGAAFAITGLGPKHEPEMIGVILSGQSNVPGFVMRMILVEASMRVAATVEGVTIYGDSPRVFRAVGPGGAPAAPMPPQQLSAPYIANMPGAIVIGGSVGAVSDVIKRIKGKEQRLALSGAPGFKDAAELRSRPGLFAFVSPGKAQEVFETLVKSQPDAVPTMAVRGLAGLLNPKAIRSAAASLTLTGGAFDLKIAAKLEPGQSSPLLDLIADQKVTPALLQPVPKGSIAVASLALKDGEKNWQKLLAAADAVVGDDGPKPTDQVREIEEKLKISIGKDIVGRIATITVALPAKQDLPKGATEMPMLFLTATDADAAEKLEKMLPSLLSLALGEEVQPVTETIQGVKVRSVPGTRLPWKAALHYGRNGTTLALGIDRKLVAASLSGKLGDSVAGEPVIIDALKGTDGSAALALWRWGHLLPELLATTGEQRRFVNGKLEEPDPAKRREKADKLRKAMAPLIDALPPLAASLARQDDQIVVSVRQRQQPGTAAKLIEGLCDAILAGATNIFDNLGAQAAPVPVPVKN